MERPIGCMWVACVLFGCAQGYETEPALEVGPLRGPTPMTLMPMPVELLDAGAAIEAYTGEPCMRGETAECICEATQTPGIKTCFFDQDSPTTGTFSECGDCQDPGGGGDVPEPDAGAAPSGPSCADQEKNGDESDVDCGGSSCPSCLIGAECNTNEDCSAGLCTDGVCELPQGEPTGAGGTCQPACTQPCFPFGVLPCCTAAGRCGCTWAPGAYCL